MRLQKLDLIRYGKFTDYSIEFAEPVEDKPDFHIIYGLNEAGKSTTLSAYLDLLFGIEHKTTYAFKHQYDQMEIGATLELGGQTQSLLRNKSRRNSLRDSTGEAMDAGVLASELAGIGRDAYTTMFSLDDDSLEEGGESILGSQGHLGELLYSASSGVAGLSQRLDQLRSDLESFYRPRARQNELGDLLNELQELKSRRDAINDKADEYARLVSVRASGQQQYDEVHQELTLSEQRLDKIRSLLNAKPPYDRLDSLHLKLAPLLVLPAVPEDWSSELPRLERNNTRLTLQKEDAGKSIAGLQQTLDLITLNQQALEAQELFAELADARTRQTLSMEKQPALQNDLQSIEHSIASILEKLEQPADRDPASLGFKVSTAAALEAQIQFHQNHQMAVKTARDEADKANQLLEKAQENLDSATADTGITEKTIASLQQLERAIAPYEGKGLAAQLHMENSAHADATDDLHRALVKLRPWAGDADDLATLSVPDAGELTALDARLDSARLAMTRETSEITRLQDEVSELSAKMVSLKQTTAGVVNDAELVSLRDQRDEAWVEHRRQLDDDSADTFENLLRQDDLAQSAKIHHSDVVARLAQSTESCNLREAELARAREKFLAAEQEHQRTTSQLEKAAVGISVKLTGLSVTTLTRWLNDFDDAQDLALKVKKQARKTTDLQEQLNQAQSAVHQALEDAGLAPATHAGLDASLEQARQAINAARQLTSSKNRLKDCQQQFATRQQELESIKNAAAEAQQTWKSLCAGCWLGDYDPLPEPGTVKQILAETRALEPLLKQRDEKCSELEALQRSQEQLEQRIASFGQQIAVSREESSLDEYFDELQRLVKQAADAGAERKNLVTQIEKQQSHAREVEQELQINREMAETMYQAFGVSTLESVREKLQQVEEKKQLEERADSEIKQLLEILTVSSLDEARAELESYDRDALEKEQASIKAGSSVQKARAEELYAALQNAESALDAIGSDNDAALLEQQREVLEMDIVEKTKDYLAQNFGILAAERALNTYRDKHRSTMLENASKAFATISRNAYTRLETQGAASTENLIGITADGGSKNSADMSKGTRFQLYLALRVAGYHEYVKTRPPLPFIADDIMETFDDERAAEAFRVFAGMAGVGQVIYLTHHAHLCDLARSVCPSVNIHELNDVV